MSTTIYVNSTWKSGEKVTIDGVEYTVGTDAFTSYDGALNYAKNNSTARNATIVMMNNSGVSGNCIDQNTHKNYYNLKVTIQDGAVMGNANSKWDMTYAFTVEAGGVLQSARPASAGYGYTHVKNVMTIGEADAEKQAVVNFINSPTIPYKTMCISVLYNGSLNVTNAIFKVGDLGMIGKSAFTDSTIEVAGSIGFAAGTQTCAGKHSMTNSTMTVKGHDLRADNTYSAADCNRIANLIMDNSTIIIDDGVENTVADVVELGVLKSGFLNSKKELIMQNNSKITVEAGTQINLLYNVSMSDSVIEGGNFSIVSGDLTMTGKSNLDIAVLDIAAEKKIVIDNTASIVADALTGTGTIEINVVDAVAGFDKVIDLADGADTTGLIDRVTVKQDGYSALIKDGDIYVASYIYVESGVVSDITAALSSAEGRVVQISGRYVDVDQATMDAIANGDVKFAAGTMFFLAEGVTTAYSDANLTVKEFGVKADLVDGVVDLAADNAVATGNIGSNDADLTLTTGDAAEGSAEVRADVTGSNVVLENSKELAITGSVSGSNVEINNADDAVLDGGSDDYSAKISADEKITFVNDGHAVVDMSAKTIEIENNSVNTITGSKLEGETVIIDAKENADGVVSETEIIATNVEIADQTVSDSKITGRVQITADTSLIDTEATGVVSVGYDKENVADTTLTLGGETTIDLLYVGNEGRENNYKLEVAGEDANVTLGQLYNRTDSETVISDEAKLNISGYWQSKGNVVVDNATVNHNGWNMYVYNNDSTSVSKITLKNGAVLNSNNSVGIVLGNKNDSPAAAIGNAELVLEGKSTLNVTNLTLQAEGEVEEVAGEKAATSMTVNDSEVNVANTLTNNSVINIVMGAEDLSDGVDDVNINAKAIKGSGTIIIDATKFAGGVDKVINVSEAGDVTVVFKEGTAAEGVKMLVNEEGDVFVSDVKAETLYVDANFKGEFGDMVGEGMYLGINAFANFEEALIAAQDNTSVSRVELLSDCLIESVINPGEAYDFKQQISFGSAEGESFKVEFSASLENGSKFSIYTMSGDTSVTFEENFEIAGMDILANGFYTNNNEMIIDGTVKALSLKQWTSNNEIVVNKTGKVVLGYGDGVLDMAYGNGSVVVNGTLKDTKDASLTDGSQFKAGYVQIRGNGNTLELNNTYFEGGSWFTDYSGTGSNFTANVSNSVLKVSGGDAAGVFTLTDGKNHTVNLKDGSRFIVANVNLGTSNVINVADSSMEISKTLANNGTISINGGIVDVATVTNNGSVSITGETQLLLDNLTGSGDFDLLDGAIIKDSTVVGDASVVGKVTFRGDNTFNNIYDFGTYYANYYNGQVADWTIEAGASLTLTHKIGNAYGLGYGDKVTINGELVNAREVDRATLAREDASFYAEKGVRLSTSAGNDAADGSFFTVNNAYVVVGASGTFSNSKTSGKFTVAFNNSVVDVSQMYFSDSNDVINLSITNSDVLTAIFMTGDKDSVYTLNNTRVVTTGSGNDRYNGNDGDLTIENGSELIVEKGGYSNSGNLTIDSATVDFNSLANTGKVVVKGESTLNIDTLTGNAIKLGDGATLVNSTVKGASLEPSGRTEENKEASDAYTKYVLSVNGDEAGKVSFEGKNIIASLDAAAGDTVTVSGEGNSLEFTGDGFKLGNGAKWEITDGAEVSGWALSLDNVADGEAFESEMLVQNATMTVSKISGKGTKLGQEIGAGKFDVTFDKATVNLTGSTAIETQAQDTAEINLTFQNETTIAGADGADSIKSIKNDSTKSTITFDNTDVNVTGTFRNKGTVNIQNGADVVVTNVASTDKSYEHYSANEGTINIENGSLTHSDLVNDGSINVNGGIVDVDVLSGAGTLNVGATFDADGKAVATELNIGELNSAVTVNDNSDKQAVVAGSIDKLTSQITTKGENKFSGMNINANAESAAGTGTLRTEAKVIIADNSEMNLDTLNVRNGGSIELGSVVDTKNFVATDTKGDGATPEVAAEFTVAGTLSAEKLQIQFANVDSKVTIAAGGAYKQSGGAFLLQKGNMLVQGYADCNWMNNAQIGYSSSANEPLAALTVDGTYAAEGNNNGKLINSTAQGLKIWNHAKLNVINNGIFSMNGRLDNSGAITVSNSSLTAKTIYTYTGATITVDDKSTITVLDFFHNQGTITINVSDSFSGTKTIVDVLDGATFDYGEINLVGGEDVIKTVNAEGDLVIYKVDTNTLFVNSEWASVADDTEIATNLVKGVNAFATAKDAIAKANEKGEAIINFGDEEYVYAGTLTSDDHMAVINKAGKYTLTGGNGYLFNYELEVNPDKEAGEYVFNIDNAYLTMAKLTLRDNVTATISDSRLDHHYFNGSGYLSVYRDSDLTITDSVIGFNKEATKVANPEDFDDKGDSRNRHWGFTFTVYGNATVTNSDLYLYVGQAVQAGFDVLGDGNVSLKDSNVDMAVLQIGTGYEEKKLSSTAREALENGEVVTATVTLDGGTLENNQYRGDSVTRTGIILGTADGKTAGKLVIKNNAVVDVTNQAGDNRYAGVEINNENSSIELIDSTLKATSVTNKGTFTVGGESTLNIDSYNNGKFVWGKAIQLLDGAIIKDSNVGGYVDAVGKVTFRGDNTFGTIQDFEASYHDNNTAVNNTEMIIEKGASVTTESAKFNLGFGDKLSVYGNLEDAKAAYEAGTLTEDDYSLDAQKGMFFQGNRAEDVTTFNVNDAYVRLGANEQSVANAKDEYKDQRLGTYNFNWTNAVVEAEETFDFKDSGEYNGNYNFNLDKTVLKVGAVETDNSYAENNPAYRGAINFADKDSTFKAKDSNVVVIGKESNNYNGGTFEFDNSEFNLNAAFVNDGSATFDGENAELNATNVINRGTVTLANGAELNAGSYSTVSAKVAFYDGSDVPENITFVAYDEAGNEIGRTTAFINGAAEDKIEDAVEVAVVKGASYKAFKADGTQIEDATFEIVADSSDANLVINGNSKVDVGTLYNGGTISVQNGTLDVTQLINSSNNFHINGGSTVTVDKLVNNAKLFISGENTIKVEDATGSGYAIRVNDGAIFNDSYIKAGNNATTRLLGSATFNGGFSAAYFETKPGEVSEEAAAGEYTITIEDDTVINASYGFDFKGNYTISGGKLVLSGGNANGKIWGFVFQSGNFDINSDIEVDGNGVTAPIHFTNATATVRSDISHANSGGEPIYIKNSNVTMTAGSTWTANTGVHINDNSTLTINDGSIYGNVSANKDSSKLILSEKALIQGNINNNGTIIINVDDTNRNAVATLINANKGANFGNIVIDEADAAAGVDYKIDAENGDLVVYNKNLATTVYVDSNFDGAFGDKVADGKYYGINAFSQLGDVAATDNTKNLVIAGGNYNPVGGDWVSMLKGGINNVTTEGQVVVEKGNLYFKATTAGEYSISGDYVTTGLEGYDPWPTWATNGIIRFQGADGVVFNITDANITSSAAIQFIGGKSIIAKDSILSGNAETESKVAVYGDVVNYGKIELVTTGNPGTALLIGYNNYASYANKLTVSGENASVMIDTGATVDASIHSSGTLVVEDNAEFTATGSVVNDGKVTVDGADFNAGKLTNNGAFTVSGESKLDINIEGEGTFLIDDAVIDGTVNVTWREDAVDKAGKVVTHQSNLYITGDTVIDGSINNLVQTLNGYEPRTKSDDPADGEAFYAPYQNNATAGKVIMGTADKDADVVLNGDMTGSKISLVSGSLKVTDGAGIYGTFESLPSWMNVNVNGGYLFCVGDYNVYDTDDNFDVVYDGVNPIAEMTLESGSEFARFGHILIGSDQHDKGADAYILNVEKGASVKEFAQITTRGDGTINVDGDITSYTTISYQSSSADATWMHENAKDGGHINNNGIINVSETGSVKINSMNVGRKPEYGTAELNINGGTVEFMNYITVGYDASARVGELNITEGGKLVSYASEYELRYNNGKEAGIKTVEKEAGTLTVGVAANGSVTVDKGGIINVGTVNVGEKGSITIDNSTFEAGSLVNNGSFALSGVVTVNTVATGNALDAAYATTLKDSKLSADLKLNAYALIENSTLSGNLSGTANITIVGKDNIFSGSFDKNIAVYGDYYNSNLTVNADAFDGNFVNNVFLNITDADFSKAISVNTNLAFIKSINGFEIENGIAGDYIFVDDKGTTDDTSDDVTYKLVKSGASISFKELEEDTNGETVYESSYLVVTNNVSMPDVTVQMAEGNTTAYVGYNNTVVIGALTKNENGGVNYLTVDALANMTVNGKVDSVNYLGLGYQAKISAGAVTGTVYNDSVVVGQKAKAEFDSLNFKGGYDSMYVGYKAAADVTGDVEDLYSLTVDYMGKMTIDGDFAAPEFTNIINVGGEASLTVTGIIENEDVNAGTIMYVGWNSQVAVNGKNANGVSIAGLEYLSVGGGDLVSVTEHFKVAGDITGTANNNVYYFGYQAVASMGNIDTKGGYDQIITADRSNVTIGNINQVDYISVGAFAEFKAKEVNATKLYNSAFVANYESDVAVDSINFGSGYNQLLAYGKEFTVNGDVNGVSYLYAGNEFTAKNIIGSAYNDTIVVAYNSTFDVDSVNFGTVGYNQFITYSAVATGDVSGVSYLYAGADFTAGAVTGTEYNDSIVAGGKFEAASVAFGAGYNQIIAYDDFKVTGAVDKVSYIYNAKDFTAGAVTGTEYNDSIVAVGEFEAASIDFGAGYNQITAYNKFSVNGDVNNVSYIYNAGDFTATGAVSGTEYNDSIVAVGKFEAASIDFEAGYNQIVAYDDFKVTGAIDNVSYIYAGKDFTAGAVTGTEYNDSLVSGYDADMTLGNVELGAGNDVVNLGVLSNTTFGGLNGGEGYDALYLGYGANLVINGSIENFEAVVGSYTNNIILTGTMNSEAKAMADAYGINVFENAELFAGSVSDETLDDVNGYDIFNLSADSKWNCEIDSGEVKVYAFNQSSFTWESISAISSTHPEEFEIVNSGKYSMVRVELDKDKATSVTYDVTLA